MGRNGRRKRQVPAEPSVIGTEDSLVSAKPAHLPEETRDPADQEKRLAFARSTLTDVQSLIRAMDTKAQFLTAVAGFLTASMVPILLARPTSAPVSPPIPAALSDRLIWFVVLALSAVAVTLATSLSVIYPRGPRKSGLDGLPGLIYPRLIVARHPEQDTYGEAIRTHTPEDLLRELAHQVRECSNIYRAKERLVRAGVFGLGVSLVAWLGVVIIKLTLLLS